MNDFIKKPNVEDDYTAEQIQELAKCAEDIVYFCTNYIRVQHPKLGAIPFEPYEYQVRMLKEFQANQFTLVLAGRQLGKSTIIAMYLLWFAMFNFDKTVLVASNKNTNAMEIMHRIKYAYEELPMWLKPGVNYYTKHSMEFDNGSKIISQATTANTGRGMSLSLLMLDELAFVPKRIQEEMWTSLAPTLSTGGSCIISSTPNGDDDLFANLWRAAEFDAGGSSIEDGNGFKAVKVEWDEHPDRDESYRQKMMKKIGELKWRQEYECEFLSSDPLLINSMRLQAMRPTPPKFTDNGFSFWKEFNGTAQYYISSDIANGIDGDYSTIEVFEWPTLEQVAELRSNKIDTNQLYSAYKWVFAKISECKHPQSNLPPDIFWSYESNSVGAAITTLYLNDEHFPDNVTLISDGENRYGMYTSSKKAMTALEFKKLVEKKTGGLIIYSDILIKELKNYIKTGASFAAKPGATDDLVSACLVLTKMLQKISEYDGEVFGKFFEYDANWVDDSGSGDPIPIVI